MQFSQKSDFYFHVKNKLVMFVLNLINLKYFIRCRLIPKKLIFLNWLGKTPKSQYLHDTGNLLPIIQAFLFGSCENPVTWPTARLTFNLSTTKTISEYFANLPLGRNSRAWTGKGALIYCSTDTHLQNALLLVSLILFLFFKCVHQLGFSKTITEHSQFLPVSSGFDCLFLFFLLFWPWVPSLSAIPTIHTIVAVKQESPTLILLLQKDSCMNHQTFKFNKNVFGFSSTFNSITVWQISFDHSHEYISAGNIGSFLSWAVSTSILRGPFGHNTATRSGKQLFVLKYFFSNT